ncbi:hypothetical protein C7271_19005 [filamentous cyanobacterium CCP5]|nr:hypothetical protein C7271_19005 [filamentous cyanobacterium CCP5]
MQIDDTRACDDSINRQMAAEYGGAWLIVPLVFEETTWGALALNIFGHAYSWQPEDVELMHSVADQVAIAIQRAQNYQQIQQELVQRQQIETKLRDRETFLRSIYDATQTGIFIIDVDASGDFYYSALNPSHERRIGIAPADFRGAQPEDMMPSDKAAKVRQNYRRCIDSQETMVYEEFLPLNGIDFWWLTSLTPLVDASGKVYRIIGTCTDISELKQAQASLTESRQTITALVNNVNACLARFRVDTDGHWQVDYISEGSQRIWGFRAEEITHQPRLWRERILPIDYGQVILPTFNTIGQISTSSLEYRYLHPEGGLRWIAVNLSVTTSEEHGYRVVNTVSWDISDRKQVESQLESRARWERVLRTITEDIRQSLDLKTILPTAVYDIRQILEADRVLVFRIYPDRTGEVIEASHHPNLGEIALSDRTDQKVPDRSYKFYRRGAPQIFTAPLSNDLASWLGDFLDLSQVQSQIIAPILQTGTDELWGIVIVQAYANHRRWKSDEAVFLQQIANQLAIAIHQSDLYKQLEMANQQLTHLSIHDSLTQLLNRRAFDSALEREWQRSVRNQTPIALMLLDIDYFKLYNDTYGHPEGDNCLVQVSQALEQVVSRPGDVVARYGGEEFIVLLPNTDAAGISKISARIQTAIAALNIPHRTSPLCSHVTISSGAVWYVPQVGDNVLPMISAADAALYQAKQQGRDRYVVKPWHPQQSLPKRE